MATAVSPYYEFKAFENDTVAASERIVLPQGLGGFNQIIVRVVVGAASGTTPTLDFDLDTSFTRDAAGEYEWVELVSMTQATGATSETKYVLRSATAGWAGVNSLEVTVGGTSPSFTGVSVTVCGANA